MKKIFNIIAIELKVVLAYLVFFILNEIMISGGKYSYNIYVVVFNVIVILVILWLFRNKYYKINITTRIKEGLIYSVTFALLDFLLVYLLLYRSNLSIYRSYSTYVYYGLLLIIPIISVYIPSFINPIKNKFSNWFPLDKPKTNHIIR